MINDCLVMAYQLIQQMLKEYGTFKDNEERYNRWKDVNLNFYRKYKDPYYEQVALEYKLTSILEEHGADLANYLGVNSEEAEEDEIYEDLYPIEGFFWNNRKCQGKIRMHKYQDCKAYAKATFLSDYSSAYYHIRSKNGQQIFKSSFFPAKSRESALIGMERSLNKLHEKKLLNRDVIWIVEDVEMV